MFRCITDLKGIAVDIDSFHSFDINEFQQLDKIATCVFLTSDRNTENLIKKNFGDEHILWLESFEKHFVPNISTQRKLLDVLKIKNTELAYLSCSHSFLEHANTFLSGSIWLSNNVSYEEASNSPDLILYDIGELIDALNQTHYGLFGEINLFPGMRSPGYMIPVDYTIDEVDVAMYSLGRYFAYPHYMNQLHPYSAAIRLNKKNDKPYFGVFNELFGSIISAAINTIKEEHNIDCVCSVPVKPNKQPRYEKMLNTIADSCHIENMGSKFECVSDYPDQKNLSPEERRNNIKNAFLYTGDLNGRVIVLIDDIITTGSTINECVRTLKNAGAKDVVIVALAINQFGSYWSSNIPQVSCPVCNEPMTLQINKYGDHFYNCLNCYRTNHSKGTSLNFQNGWELLCMSENDKFDTFVFHDADENKNLE